MNKNMNVYGKPKYTPTTPSPGAASANQHQGFSFLFFFFNFVGLAYQGKDIVFRSIIEYSSLRDFGSWVIGLFLIEDF
jgi:hypothetical protein